MRLHISPCTFLQVRAKNVVPFPYIFSFLASTPEEIHAVILGDRTPIPHNIAYVVSYQSYDRVTFCFGRMVTSESTSRCEGTIWGPYVIPQQSCDVSIVIALRWQYTFWVCGVVCRYRYTGQHALVFCVLMPCSRTRVGIRWYTTLYQVYLVISDSGVQAIFSQTVAHSAIGYLTRIRINGKSCPKRRRSVCSL
jgi:hypothetical protein